ncbi:hypothetical protein F5887DRAFT_1192365 [Amanita rubescens]|nr:hypothetical protein F5887DRAFT_1192365 [Amanita rubescens]
MATANSFQMPKVFIIPPEEDHSPSWCYFDAAKRGLNRFSQVDSFDSAALFSFGANNSAASKNGSSDNVVLGALDHHASICVENDINYDCEAELLFEEGWDFSDQSLQGSHVPQCALPYGYEEPGHDSDITEVIKIGRRGRGEEELGPTDRSTSVIRSKTLKSRASRVFHSLKKVGRRKSFKLPPVRDNVMAPQANFASASLSEISQTKIFDASQALTLPGRSSILASQLFMPPSGFRSRSSFSHAEGRVNSLVPHPNPPPAFSESPKARASLSSQDSAHSDKPTLASRAASPSPSFLNKRHFSKINIQKLFSFTTTSSSVSTTSSTISGGLTLSSNNDTVPTPPLPPSCSDQEQGTDCVEGVDRIVSHSMGIAADSRLSGRTDSHAKVDIEQKQHNNLACNELNSFSTELTLGLGSDLDLELGLELGLPSTICKENDASPRGPRWDSSRETERKRSLDDINFEMRLDSLRFDELSFDVGKF